MVSTMKLKNFFYYLFLFLFKVSVFGGVSNPLTPDGLKECWELYTNEPAEFLRRNKGALINALESEDNARMQEREVAEKHIAKRKSQLDSKIKSEEKIINGLSGALDIQLPTKRTYNEEYPQYRLDVIKKRRIEKLKIRSYETFREFKLALEENQKNRCNSLKEREITTLDFINEEIPIYGPTSKTGGCNPYIIYRSLLGQSHLLCNNFWIKDMKLTCNKENIKKIKEGNIEYFDLTQLVYLLAKFHIDASAK